MAKRIIKKIGGDRIGSGNKMNVATHGYGYSTHDRSKIRRTSMSFGTIVPMNCFIMPSNSRIRMNLDALITSAALKYQLYGSAKFQIDVFSARMALYNPKMLLNLNDQGYNISDIKFPQMSLFTKGMRFNEAGNVIPQVNPSALLAYLGVRGNGQRENTPTNDITRQHNAMPLLMYYQTVKEYYANKQEKRGYVIHAEASEIVTVSAVEETGGTPINLTKDGMTPTADLGEAGTSITIYYSGSEPNLSAVSLIVNEDGNTIPILDMLSTVTKIDEGEVRLTNWIHPVTIKIYGYRYTPTKALMKLVEYDLKAIDRMQMAIMSNVENTAPIIIDSTTELPYGASFQNVGYTSDGIAIDYSQEGLCVGTYQSDVFNNWLDNDTINALNAKNKVKVDENGEFSIDTLNITQKLYNYNMRVGITDGTLDEWREMTYGQASKGKSLKPVYEGGLSKEILFDQIVSTAATDESPLGDIASRGSFGNKHKGGYVQIDTDEEKIVMVLAKITPRIVYNQGNDWTTNLKTLEDLHKPALDKIGYQNLITDTMAVFDTVVKSDGTLITKSAGKQPAWMWYRTDYDDALGLMAYEENYKVFGREYEYELVEGEYRIKDLTTYIDPTKFNDVFTIDSLDAMNFDVQVGMDINMTLTMSEEVIPGL